MSSLSLKNIYKIYPNGFEAVKDFNLEVEDKEFIIFVGPSGCGKSTTLRMIAGLEEISKGELYIDGQWTTDAERDNYKMQYDGEHSCYYTALLQKQGYYSYQYLTQNGGIPPSEGSFFQTENRYQALVYYKGIGARTWRLVGYRSILFR